MTAQELLTRHAALIARLQAHGLCVCPDRNGQWLWVQNDACEFESIEATHEAVLRRCGA